MALVESSSAVSETLPFIKARHIKFFKRLFQILPEALSSQETNRLTLAYFIIAGLDLLGAVNELEAIKKREFIEWIYSLQISRSEGDLNLRHCGFRGSTFLKLKDHDHCASLDRCGAQNRNCGHIAMTYSALASLLILGDDLGRVDKLAITSALSCLQQDDGGYIPSEEEMDNDMRFVFCACAISYMLNDWSGVNQEKVIQYILRRLRYDGGFAQTPETEAHGGSTYCAVASLYLMGMLDVLSQKQKDRLIRWCVLRLHIGYQGRPNKPDDTCYSFWIGATLAMLCPAEWSRQLTWKTSRYVFSTQDPIIGGLAKWPDQQPDPLHTYLGLSGLSLCYKIEDLEPVNPALNISIRAYEHLCGIIKKSKE